jgi:bifunctional lysine-specific demethylase and histidyl-hydroxylase NO66
VIADVSDGGAIDRPSALARCVDCTAAEFAERHWGRALRLTRAAQLSAGFTDLLDATAVDELVSSRGLRTPFARMAKDGTMLPASAFTRPGGAGATIGDQLADDRVLAAFADGATLVLQALHRTWPPLVSFGTRLADELGHPVQINAYITPRQSRGFAPHYDVHDVFVLQVAGRKRWTIHAPVITDPLENQPWDEHREAVAARAHAEPLLDAVLEPGDALYLPRGTIHAAEAMGETTIHLTVGVHPITRYHLVRQLLDTLQDDVALRSSLPAGVDLADPGVLAEHVQETVALLRDRLPNASVSRLAERVGADLMRRTRPEPIGPLAQLTAAAAVDPGTVLRLRAGTRLRIDETPDAVRLVLLDRTITLPASAAEAVKVAAAGASFRAGELPGLDSAGQVALVRRLLREGLLVAG